MEETLAEGADSSNSVETGNGVDSPEIAPVHYEYLDHTADVQLHTWGTTMAEAFEQIAMAMFGYMTEIDSVQMKYSFDIEAEGDDMESLLYHFLDEWLFAFSAEPFFIARTVKIIEFDRTNFTIRSRGWGESFDLKKHPQGFIQRITRDRSKIEKL